MLETRFGDDPLAGLKDSTSPGTLTVTFGSKLINKSPRTIYLSFFNYHVI